MKNNAEVHGGQVEHQCDVPTAGEHGGRVHLKPKFTEFTHKRWVKRINAG